MAVASPEVGKDDHTRDGGVGTPKRGEGVALDLHDKQQYEKICGAEDHHHPDPREKQRTAGCNHVEHGNCGVVGRLIDVDDAVSSDKKLQGEGSERPQDVERGGGAENEKGQHALAAGSVRFEEQHAERQQERQEALCVEHEGCAHVMRHGRGENSVQSQPNEALDKLMDGEKQGQGGEEQFAAMFDSGQGDDADGAENSAADKVRGG